MLQLLSSFTLRKAVGKRGVFAAVLALVGFLPAAAQDSPNDSSHVQPLLIPDSPRWLAELDNFVDRAPNFMARNLPNLQPHGYYRIYIRPHLGDVTSRDFIRVPVGAEYKINDHVQLRGELQDYFTTGLKHSVGYGISGFSLGGQYEHEWISLPHTGTSVGMNFNAPLSRPPPGLTDGYRHTDPYVAATFPLVPEWRLIGFTSLGADFLNHTALPSAFGKNELHTNSLTLSVGTARDWKHFHTSLTGSVNSSVLISDEGRQVYSLRPEIVFPFRVRPQSGVVTFLTLGTYWILGPEGKEVGAKSSLRVEFRNHR